jgi:hypothetical protein
VEMIVETPIAQSNLFDYLERVEALRKIERPFQHPDYIKIRTLHKNTDTSPSTGKIEVRIMIELPVGSKNDF